MSQKSVYVILAEGFEEIETVTPVDVLRRSGLKVTLAGLDSLRVRGANGIVIHADVLLKELKELPDAVILPGGSPGADNLAKSPRLEDLLKEMNQKSKVIGAICAAPGLVLAKQGILDNRKATCYPSYEKNFNPSTTFVRDRVVKDAHIITSRGPGSSMEFALYLVKELVGEEPAKKLEQGLLVCP